MSEGRPREGGIDSGRVERDDVDSELERGLSREARGEDTQERPKKERAQ
jgi:hypothetical protein